jgi:histidinol-phosphate aminotransferase
MFDKKLPLHIEALPPYTPIEPFEVLSKRLGRSPEAIIKVDANENPYGPSPKARAALTNLTFPHIYPDPESRDLRDALAAFVGVPAEFILAGAGADELIDLLLRVVMRPGETVLNLPPTFGMYAFDTRLNAGMLHEIPRRSDFSLDIPAIAAAVEMIRPRLLFLTNPNNPDGSMISRSDLETILNMPVLVILDEAYIEFADGTTLGREKSLISQVPHRENLIVLRTFSKWAGLAGLRVGYGAFPAWMMSALWKAKQPYNVNVAANAAALASLEDLPHLTRVVAQLRGERVRLQRELAAVPYLQPYPSQSNFVLSRVSGRSAAQVKADLAAQGVFIRYFAKPGLEDHIRVSAGRPEDTTAVLHALHALT